MQSSNDILENIKIVITKSIGQRNNLKIVGIGCDATCSLGKNAFQARLILVISLTGQKRKGIQVR